MGDEAKCVSAAPFEKNSDSPDVTTVWLRLPMPVVEVSHAAALPTFVTAVLMSAPPFCQEQRKERISGDTHTRICTHTHTLKHTDCSCVSMAPRIARKLNISMETGNGSSFINSPSTVKTLLNMAKSF